MTSTTPKKVRVPDLALMKQRGDRIVMLTAYDATMARLLDVRERLFPKSTRSNQQTSDVAGRRLIPSPNDRTFEELKGPRVPVS